MTPVTSTICNGNVPARRTKKATKILSISMAFKV